MPSHACCAGRAAEEQQRVKRARLDEKHASKLRKRLQAGLDKLDALGSAFVGHAVSRHGRVSLFRTPEAVAMQAQDARLASAQARHQILCCGQRPFRVSLFGTPEAAMMQARDVRLAKQARVPRQPCWLAGLAWTGLCRVAEFA